MSTESYRVITKEDPNFTKVLYLVEDNVAESQISEEAILRASVGQQYFVEVPKPQRINSKEFFNESIQVLKAIGEVYHNGIPSLTGKIVAPDPSTWSVSIWTNAGEKKIPYQESLNWENIIDDLAQTRNITNQVSEKIIKYVRIESPFMNIGFSPQFDGITEFALLSCLKEPNQIVSLVTKTLKEGTEEAVQQFFDEVTKS